MRHFATDYSRICKIETLRGSLIVLDNLNVKLCILFVNDSKLKTLQFYTSVSHKFERDFDGKGHQMNGRLSALVFNLMFMVMQEAEMYFRS